MTSREKRNEYQRRWREKNREKVREQNREYQREYREKNKEVLKLKRQWRRARALYNESSPVLAQLEKVEEPDVNIQSLICQVRNNKNRAVDALNALDKEFARLGIATGVE